MRVEQPAIEVVPPEQVGAAGLLQGVGYLVAIVIGAAATYFAYRFVRRKIKRFRKHRHRDHVQKVQTRRIESLGLKVVDNRGWVDGEFLERRYELHNRATGAFVAGPFPSRGEALKAAKHLKEQHRKNQPGEN